MTLLDTESAPTQLAASGAAELTLLPSPKRFSLRARAANAKALSKAVGAPLPEKIGRRSQQGSTEVLCLGPDEWTILASEADADALIDACAKVYAKAPHSLTDISDRDISVRISGPKAAELLTVGCPRDIDRIAEGEARRTVIDGASAVLWRDGAQEFRLDLWRSFAPHIIDLLQHGCGELAAE
jgi:sarcosine oxidase subunit gamma